MWFCLLLWQACSTDQPLPLPPPQQQRPPPQGRMVAAGTDLRGYLVKPHVLPAPGVLLLVDQINEQTRQHATTQASEGRVALAVETDTPTTRAQAYLDALADTRGVTVTCLREGGC